MASCGYHINKTQNNNKMTEKKNFDNSKNSEALIEKITILEKEIEYLKEVNLRYSMIIR